jgi:hypothetical protein
MSMYYDSGDGPRPSPERDDMITQLRELERHCKAEAVSAGRAAKRWKIVELCLGLPAAVLAGIAGIAGLADTAGRVPAGILALLAAGVSAAATYLKAGARGADKDKQMSAWKTLASEAKLNAEFDGRRARSVVLRGQLRLLLERSEQIQIGNLDKAGQLQEKGLAQALEQLPTTELDR